MKTENNLIYFTLGNNPNYIKLAELCLGSIIKTGYTGDFLFITDLKEQCEKQISCENTVHFMDSQYTTLLTSASNKIKIYEWKNINNYSKIIYSDLDILWFINPDIIFSKIKKNRIYLTNQENETSLLTRPNFGGLLLNDKEKTEWKGIKGVNAGFFCFDVNEIEHFKTMDMFLQQNIDKVNVCLEQPFINVYCFRNDLVDISFNEYISHRGYDITSKEKPIIHFPGGPGNFHLKYMKMKRFLESNINENKN